MSQSSPTAEVPNRFERRRQRTREDLLAAAVRVLAGKGLHQTKITDIALEADVGVGTFYLHFPTKDALFDAVVEDTVVRLKAAVDAARSDAPNPIEEIRQAHATFCRFATDNREVFRIVFGHAAAYNDVIRAAQALFATDLERSVQAGIAAGLIRPVSSAIVAQALIGMATQTLSWSLEAGMSPEGDLAETLTTLALDGLRVPAGQGD